MIELVRSAAAEHPDVVALRAVGSGGSQAVLSYAELLGRAERVAAGLRARGITRVAVSDPDLTAVVPLLAGADLAGVEVCVYAAAASAADIAETAGRFEHTVLVTTRADLDAVSGVEILPLAALLESAPDGRGVPPARPLLVHTTGTTGAVKGVRHDWARLTRAVEGAPVHPGQRWLLAYGLNQFGGLQVLLRTLATRATLVGIAPLTPTGGLAAIRAHGLTHVSATPTFWRFVLAEVARGTEPAPALQVVTLGGEAVPAPLLAQLEVTFPAAKVTQVYAANEFGLGFPVRDRAAGLPLAELDRDPHVQFKVVDGQLWVRSATGMLGYHGDAPVEPDAWRPTGDLVEIVGDRVEFRGRDSDVINVGGVKVHPLPVEERISAVPGVALVRVYGRPNALTGAVVAAEVVAVPGADTDDLDDAVRAACADLPPAYRPRSVKFVEQIETRGAKLVRSAAAPTREAGA